MRKLAVAALTILLCSCRPDNDPKAPVEAMTEVKPLDLGGFTSALLQLSDECSFQRSFVQWFVIKYSPELVVTEGGCGSAATADPKYSKFASQCDEGKGCRYYTFVLNERNGSVTQYYGLIKDTETGRRQGMIATLDESRFVMFVVPVDFPEKEYRENSSKAPNPNLPLMSVTFNEALKQDQ